MAEWAPEFEHRFNRHVEVHYGVTSEASDEEWQDDPGDGDAIGTDPVRRRRQNKVAQFQLLQGHKDLFKTPSKDEVKGLIYPKLHRAPG